MTISLPCPEDASFPEEPTWTLESAPQEYIDNYVDPESLPKVVGSGETLDFDPHEIGGSYTFKASCCNSSDTIIVNVVDVELEIYWGAQLVSDTTTDTIVGLGMNLHVSPPLLANTKNEQWTVSGDRIKDYDTTSITDQVVDLEANDLNDVDAILFYWVGEQESTETVTVLAQIEANGEPYDEVWCDAEAEFDVKRPTMAVTATLGQPTISPPGPGPSPGFYNTDPNSAKPPNGFIGTITTITPPQGFSGDITWAQIILSTDKGAKRISDGKCFAYRAQNKLDGTFPYGSTFNQPPLKTMVDSPGIGGNLSTSDKIWDNTDFRSYAFFKPHTHNNPSNDSIFVALKQVDWGQSATATAQGSPPAWVFAGQPTTHGPTTTDANTSTPEWDGVIATVQFLEVQCP